MQTDTLHPVVARFLADPDPQLVAVVLSHLEMREYAGGEEVCAAGDAADALYFIIEGRLAVHTATGMGRRTQVVALLDAGTVAGEGVLVPGRRRGATIVAVEPTLLACLNREGLVAVERHSPAQFVELFRKIFAIVARRLEKSSERLGRVL